MLIHDNFKRELLKLSADTLKAFGLPDVIGVPNDTILSTFLASLRGTLKDIIFITEDGMSPRGKDIKTISAIDDELLWTNAGLIRWNGISELISARFFKEEKLFEAGQILKVITPTKLRLLGFTNYNQITGKYYQMVEYVDQNMVRVKDFYGNDFQYPQRIFLLTQEESLETIYHAFLKKQALDRLEDAKKHNIDAINNGYQQIVREYLKQAELLADALSEDIDKKAEELVQGQLDFNSRFKQFPQIKNVRFLNDHEVEVITACIISAEDSHYPLGRYKIVFDTDTMRCKIFNLDINSQGRDFQHPHVNREGDVCRGDWLSPIKKSVCDNGDYLTGVLAMIEFLEHYNDRSPYISLEEFNSKWKKQFKAAADAEKKERGEEVKEVKPRARRTVATAAPTTSDDTPIWVELPPTDETPEQRAARILREILARYGQRQTEIGGTGTQPRQVILDDTINY